jgi:RNA polymerase sigma factor (sigma-70 family)
MGDMEKNGVTNVVVRELRTLFDVGVMGALSDGQLLDRFADRREGAVFEAIVHRHGPMVWGVCLRVLRDQHDAEDAFQATFLVLARKASSVIPREKLGNWLYGVANQTAKKARAMRAKRRARERQVPDMSETMAVPDQLRDELAESLDREVSRLPDKYRIPIILSELEGKTHRETAEQLGWPIGTVSSRLSRARSLLAKRLTRRGMSLSTGALTAIQAQKSASASMTIRLIGSTAQAASLYAAGEAAMAGTVSANVVALTCEVLRTMLLSKLKVATAILLAASMAVTIGHVLNRCVWAQDFETALKPFPSTIVRPLVGDEKLIQGAWEVILMEKDGLVVTNELRSLEFRENDHMFMRWLKDQGPTPSDNPPSTSYHLDQSACPKGISIDWNLPQPKRGIYTLAGDILIICLDEGIGQDRPTNFSARTGSGRTLIVLKKKL